MSSEPQQPVPDGHDRPGATRVLRASSFPARWAAALSVRSRHRTVNAGVQRPDGPADSDLLEGYLATLARLQADFHKSWEALR
ncbi:hypothetical protein WEB32_02305 [Streptomyces netropsis]|uniref:Uncharacterized protein n=1 Tax=Streptomyces netropsis TaxID=55404 RepID=A0A7W7PHF6_STRNE|nr:hypothetical protein [Streptomyces netropsis]MBB4889203.1 hypothetical protein [Streptomyces netropsis]GGR46707.1 hypothetical protein GCM10010219_60200 [Streptomyces netropsis]